MLDITIQSVLILKTDPFKVFSMTVSHMWQLDFSGQCVPVDRHTSESPTGCNPFWYWAFWSGSPVLQSKVPGTGSTSDVLLLPFETKNFTQKPNVWEEKSVPCTQPCGLEVQRGLGVLCEETRACPNRVPSDRGSKPGRPPSWEE